MFDSCMVRTKAGKRPSCFVVLALAIAAGASWTLGGDAEAAEKRQRRAAPMETNGTPTIEVTLFKSRTIRVDRPYSSAVVGSTDIADVLPMTDQTLYIQGKKIGTTNISIFDQSMRLVMVYDLEVTPDTGSLQDKIRAGGGSGIRVSSSQNQIVLSGVAANAVAADRAAAIAKSMVPEGGSVVNAITVAPSQQVMLRVRFIEASRTAGRELGVDIFGSNRSRTAGFRTGRGIIGVDPDVGQTPSGVPIFATLNTLVSGSQPFGIALANIVNGGTNIDILITALESKGLARRLAEPDLVALSGDTAAFLAGGEFPVQTVQPTTGTGTVLVTTEYKPFGVQLTFSPTVLANGIINLRLAPSVSEIPQFVTGVQGSQVPVFSKREARTTIELRDGQSFAIAGLLRAENRRNVAQLPWVGDVPVLGTLFSSNDFQQSETDLVVIVTPHLVAPSVPGQRLATPLDRRIPSNDLDFFLMRQMELRKETDKYVTNGAARGPYGHIVPVQPSPLPLSSRN
jgi:pilus assembly protein CpaC